jgi:hypothetical protein
MKDSKFKLKGAAAKLLQRLFPRTVCTPLGTALLTLENPTMEKENGKQSLK